jgi:N-acetylneuraminate lyase
MDPMETIELGGILPAIVTPVRQDGALSVEAFQRLAARLYAAGVDGLYVNGQTGEGLLQPVEQRKQVAEAARAVTPPGKQLIVHVGAHRTEDAVELARHASRIGVQAISSLPPLGPYSFDEVRAYYEAIASASEVPVIVYYYPAISPGVRTLEEIERLLEIPGVIGLKFTDFDLYKLSILKRHGCRLIFNGHDEVLAAGLLLGADGGIGSFYNLIPELFVELFRLARQGQWEQARQVQQRINELVEICLRFPLIPAIKTILGWTGLPCGEALRPRRSLRVEEMQQLRALLRESSFAFLLDGAA